MTNDNQRSNSQGGVDNETHHLLQIKNPPASLVALRSELLKHSDISKAAQEGRNFEECVGIIAAKLDIVLDGMYDGAELCAMLVDNLRKRHLHPNAPHLRTPGAFVNVELVEREGTVSIEEFKETKELPPGTVITEEVKTPLQISKEGIDKVFDLETRAINRKPEVFDGLTTDFLCCADCDVEYGCQKRKRCAMKTAEEGNREEDEPPLCPICDCVGVINYCSACGWKKVIPPEQPLG